MELRLLPQSYQGMPIHFEVKTKGYFHAQITTSDHAFGVLFQYEAFPEQKVFHFDDVLMSDWLKNPIVYGAFDQDQLIGFVELNKEWNQRLRISNIFVNEERRHLGVGTVLIRQAKAYAASQHMRGIVLETQSYNVPAIRFYQTHGFVFLGCDLAAFSNEDVKRQEIRLEMYCPL